MTNSIPLRADSAFTTSSANTMASEGVLYIFQLPAMSGIRTVNSCRISNYSSPRVGKVRADPRNEHSKARPRGPTEAYIVRYVAGSALGASNAARQSLSERHLALVGERGNP